MSGRTLLAAAGCAAIASGLLPARAAGQGVDVLDTQIQYNWGENVAPLYEGWIRNPDGSVDMWFGYLNKNYEEVLHVPIGPDNHVQPGGPDQGQPTVFIPRRRRGGAASRREGYVFRVRLPDGFDEDDELIWTVTAHGKTDRAVGTLLDVYVLEAPPDGNQPPAASLTADETAVAVGESIALTAAVSDDGLPDGDRARERAGVRWQRYRGPGNVTFDPPRSSYPDGANPAAGMELTTRATFSEPGTYLLRAVVNDGDANPAGWPRIPSTTFASVTVEVRPN